MSVGPLNSEVSLDLTIAFWEMGVGGNRNLESQRFPLSGICADLTVDIQGPWVQSCILTGAGGD